MHIQVENVNFSYMKNKDILRNVSFDYTTPEILCILGANGVGKSTLLKAIVHEINPVEGCVYIDGKESQSYSAQLLARKIAYIPQRSTVVFPFPVIDIVVMGRTPYLGYFARPTEKDKKIALEKLRYLNIEHLENIPFTNLSGGEQQLTLLASALAQEPELLVFDEPTAHLDFGHQYRFIELVRQLANQGIGVIMTTHSPDHPLSLHCQTLILQGGRLIAYGNATDVVTAENLSRIYDISTNIVSINEKLVCVPGEINE